MRILAYAALTLAIIGFVYLGFISLILLWDADVMARPGAGAASLEELAARHNDTFTGSPARYKARLAGAIAGILACSAGIWWLDRQGSRRRREEDL